MRHREQYRGRVLIEVLEDRTLLAATVGSLDAVTLWPNGMPFQVQGWAFDADQGPNGINPVTVRLDIDGFPAQTQPATLARADIVPVVGSANHGYSFTVAPLAPGNHTLRVVAIDQPFGSEVTLGTQAVTVQVGAMGVVDAFSLTRVAGWAIDPVAPTIPVTIRVDVDGSAVATQDASQVRGDLAPFLGSVNHGYNIALPTLSQGPHTINVVALSIAGAPTLLGTFAASPPGPPFGNLDVANETLIGGWAVDPNTTSAGTMVRIDIDGAPFRTLTTNIQRPDLTQFGSGPFGFQFATPLLGVGQHTVQMFAIDVPGGNAVLIGQDTFSVGSRTPIGSVDVLVANKVTTQVAGWTIDPDAPTEGVKFRVDVDGLPAISGTATLDRPDLLPIFGTSMHGYQVTLPAMLPGSHTVAVYAFDLQTGLPTLLGSSQVTVTT